MEENNFIKNVKEKSGGGTVVGNGYADVKKVEGNTIVWNQLNGFSRFGPYSDNNVTWSKSGNTITVTVGEGGPTAGGTIYLESGTVVFTSGHIYYFSVETDFQMSITTLRFGPSSREWFSNNKVIWKWPESVSPAGWFGIRYDTNANAGTYNLRNIQLIDLTKMFGETVANSMTVEEFEQLFPMEYAPYCEGRLVSLGGYGIKWNQIVGSSTTSVTLTSGHKFYTKISGTASVVTGSGNTQSTTGGTDMVCDLTKMFGPGSEPTLEEFEAMFGTEYRPYDAGTEMNILNKMELEDDLSVKSTGFNLWDEEWEYGTINDQGQLIPSSTHVRTKSFIPVQPNTEYSITLPSLLNNNCYIYFYDITKQYIPYSRIYRQNPSNLTPFTTPDNAYYIRFYVWGATSAPYNNDICINLSDPAKNGTYLPYTTSTQDLSWIYDLEYTPSGSTTSEKLFPYGLLSAGTVHDEVTDAGAVKRVGAVDLGSLSWSYEPNTATPVFSAALSIINAKSSSSNMVSPMYTAKYYFWTSANEYMCVGSGGSNLNVSNNSYTDAASFKAAMSGVMLYYELTEPITVTFTSPKDLGYNVQSGGTEELLPTNPSGSGPITAPVLLSVNYPLDAVGTLTNLPRNYISVASMDSFTTALGNFLNANITRTWDAANEKYTFTVVSRT